MAVSAIVSVANSVPALNNLLSTLSKSSFLPSLPKPPLSKSPPALLSNELAADEPNICNENCSPDATLVPTSITVSVAVSIAYFAAYLPTVLVIALRALSAPLIPTNCSTPVTPPIPACIA